MGPSDINRFHFELGDDIINLYMAGYRADEIQNFLFDMQNRGVIDSARFPILAGVKNAIPQNIGNFIQHLSNSGAKYIVVLTHIDELYRSVIARDFINPMTKGLNNIIAESIKQKVPNANIIYADYGKLVEEVSNNPTKYLSAADIAGTYNNYGFMDATSHPTAAAHKITAQYVSSVIEAPSRVALVRELPISVGTNAIQNTHANAYNSLMHPVEQFYTAEIGGDYIHNSTKSISKKKLGLKNANTTDAHAQINYKINENLMIGLQLNGVWSHINFKDHKGKANMREYLVSVNGTYKFSDNPFFIYGAFGAGQIKYDIKRHIALGLATRVETGKPSGTHIIGTIGAGYNFITEDKVALTPFFNVNYQDVSIKKYKEKGVPSSTTMSFKIPNRQSLITEIGATVAKDFAVKENLTITPSLTLSYGYECMDTIKKEAKGKVLSVSYADYFKVPTYKINRSYLNVNGELLAKTDANISYGIKGGAQFNKTVKQYSVGLFGKIAL